MKMHANLLAATSLVAMSGFAMPAAAQSAAAESADVADGEIFVTARKREEKLNDVPLTIGVLSEDVINRKGISDAAAVANQTPGLTFDVGLVPSDTRIAIRGLQATRGRPNVAILVDGVDTTSENFGLAGGGVLANLRLVDVARIEVVKGPQTVLYGRSAFAGAINYITKRPGDELEGTVSAMGGRFDTYELKAAVGGPLGGGLSARANFGYYNTNGDYRNPVTKGELNAAKVVGGAFALQYKNDSNFSAYARLQYSKEKYSERAQVLLRSVDPITGAVRTQDGGVQLQSQRCRPPAGSITSPATCTVPASNPFLYTLRGDVSRSATYQLGQAGIDISGDPNNGGKPFSGSDIRTWRGTLEMEWKSDDWTLTSLTGYTDNASHLNSDFDNTSYQLQATTPNPSYNGPTLAFFRLPPNQGGAGWPLNYLPSYGLSAEFDTSTNIKQFSQEMRASYEGDRVRLLLDGLYWHEKSIYRDASVFWLREGGNTSLAGAIAASQGGSFNPTAPGFFFHLLSPSFTAANPQITQRITRITDSYSMAASFEYDLTEKLKAAVEGRIIYDKIRYTGFNFDPTPVNTYRVRNATNNPTQLTENAVSFSKFNPRFSLSWNSGNGLLLFANWARGSKPGGIDTTDQNGNVTDGQFKPESVDSYELGGKYVGMDGRFVFNASLFYSIYKDQQIGVIDNSGPVAISRTDNIGQSKSKGFEVELNFQPVKPLFLRAAYTYTDSKYTDYIPPRCSNVDAADTQSGNCNFTGRQLPFTPKQQLNLSARLDLPVGADNKFWFEADTRFSSKRFMSSSNLFWLPAYNQTDIRAGYQFGNFSVEAFVDNVLKNKDPRTGTSTVDYGYFDLNSFNLPRGALVALAPRRTFGLRLGAKF